MNETIFKVGDSVEWCGVRGVIEKIDKNNCTPIIARFNTFSNINKTIYTEKRFFEIDGKYLSWHTESSLKLIEKAKKPKEKVKLYAYISASVFEPNLIDIWSTYFSMRESGLEGYIRLPNLDQEVFSDE